MSDHTTSSRSAIGDPVITAVALRPCGTRKATTWRQQKRPCGAVRGRGRRTGAYRSGEDVKATLVIPRVSRADLAEFMLRQLCSDTHVRRTPAIMY
jgi:hypothetical protein